MIEKTDSAATDADYEAAEKAYDLACFRHGFGNTSLRHAVDAATASIRQRLAAAEQRETGLREALKFYACDPSCGEDRSNCEFLDPADPCCGYTAVNALATPAPAINGGESGLLRGTYPLPVEHYEAVARNLANLWTNGNDYARTSILAALLRAAAPAPAPAPQQEPLPKGRWCECLKRHVVACSCPAAPAPQQGDAQ